MSSPLLLNSVVELLLVGLASSSAMVALKQLLLLRRVKHINQSYLSEAGPLLVDWRLSSLSLLAVRFPESPVARVFARMSTQYLSELKRECSENPVSKAGEEALLEIQQNSAELLASLPLLTQIAGISGLIGLTGTLLAPNLSQALLVSLSSIAIGGLSLGLHRLLTARAKTARLALELSAEELLNEMAYNYDHDAMEQVLLEAA